MSLPTQTQNPTGLHSKYTIQHTDGTPIDPEAEYFVLRLSPKDDGDNEHFAHILASKYALAMYADFIEEVNPTLADDIRIRYKLRNGIWYALKLFQLAVHDCAVAHGWWEHSGAYNEIKQALLDAGKEGYLPYLEHLDRHNDGEKIALMHSELSEALEALRKDLYDDKLKERAGVEVELADCVIRILDYAEQRGLDIAGAMLEKHQYNKGRSYKHGGKNF